MGSVRPKKWGLLTAKMPPASAPLIVGIERNIHFKMHTMYIVQCILYNVYFIMHSYNVKYTLYIIHYKI